MTAHGEQRRRRVLALTGLWLFLAGLLTALSFVVVAVVASAGLLVVALAAAALRLLSRLPIRPGLRAALDSSERALGKVGTRLHDLRVRQHARRAGIRAREVATAAPGRTQSLVVRAGQAYASAVYRVSPHVARAVEAGGRLIGSPRLGRRRQALRLNERGAQLRRRGDPEQAAEQHRVALEIVRELGDPHAEALTLNSLALALAQGGADAAAVQHFEQALTVLRELGDEEHEGQVIANLGFVHGRQGRSEEAVTLLSSALDKLPPESPAYRQVEEQLSRAS
jgi:tetratricopeptide (TPR) repeat protein